MSVPTTYARYELVRTFRSKRFVLLSLGFPLALFYLVAGQNRHEHLDGIAFPLYYMVGMASWGAMAAVIAAGARIATERSVGWNRQLRVTPLSTRAYFVVKVASGYAMALASLALLYAAGLSLGVHMPVPEWLEMTGMILVGLVPLALLGIWLGHVLTADAVGPAMGGATALLALLGGAWGPLAKNGALGRAVEWLPSYWLVQAGRLARAGEAWPEKAWVVVAIWTFVLARMATRAWARDTGRA